MIVETLLGVAIAAAVIGVIMLVRALLPRSFPEPDVERLTVLRCTGKAEGLEAALRRDGGVGTYILDAGLTPEAHWRAELLACRFGAQIMKDFTQEPGDEDGRK